MGAIQGSARKQDGPIQIGLTKEEAKLEEAEFYSEEYPQIPQSVLDNIENGPMDKSLGLKFEDRKRLLKDGYLPMENGYTTLADGTKLVATLTDMPNVTGEMMDWWFWWHLGRPIRYKLWHPLEHARNGCLDPERLTDPSLSDKEKYLTTHFPVEKINDDTLHPIALKFVDPLEFGFTQEEMAEANSPTIICVHLLSPNRKVQVGRMIHFVRNTDRGVELRSRFWLGYKLNVKPAPVLNRVVNARPVKATVMSVGGVSAYNLAVHCATEFNKLASILPDVYGRFK